VEDIIVVEVHIVIIIKAIHSVHIDRLAVLMAGIHIKKEAVRSLFFFFLPIL
jgi:hypothetical protein